MKPVLALVGRPNVGKSTLFNQLTGSRDALVADFAGLTRDRQYGTARPKEGPEWLVIDTGGLSGEQGGIDALMQEQAWLAVEEADLVAFMVDARAGITAADEEIAQHLRRTGKTVLLVVNKIDGLDESQVRYEYYGLGLGEPELIAAAHNRGLSSVWARLEDYAEDNGFDAKPEPVAEEGIIVGLIGRPNVGKSTLANRILGEERVLAFDEPGTTRDSIFIPFERDGKPYTLIDTAGVRRRGRIKDKIEKFSIVKTLQAIDAANVIVLVLDAHEAITEQDQSLLGFVAERGRALVIAVNKWDGLDADQRERIRQQIDMKLGFADYAEIHFISALHGSNVGHLFKSVDSAFENAMKKLSTNQLTRTLEEAVENHQPPLVNGRRIKLRYAHQGGSNPPVIVIHGKQTARLPGHYQRYLETYFRREYQLSGTPVRIAFRTDDNPYEGRFDKRTPLQRYKEQKAAKRRQSGYSSKR
ncbi:MAG TPA: ribosome biogenesis GTPase Der [Halothiobacillaceae bacterium]|nr:ribosome biogenesis GTPase Der [Halothiobacillaceae bacterium]